MSIWIDIIDQRADMQLQPGPKLFAPLQSNFNYHLFNNNNYVEITYMLWIYVNVFLFSMS